MKSVRLYYRKTGRMRFVSHLDMNRFMIRAVRRAKIPIWYTEGFNPHPYITFALPLPLGFESSEEIMDIRLTDDDFPISSLCELLNSVCPEYIRFYDAAEPKKKIGAVGFADYEITFDDNLMLKSRLNDFFSKDEIICTKKTKRGEEKQFNAAEKISALNITDKDGNTVISCTLPAGSVDNINPELLISAFYENTGNDYYCYSVVRTGIFDTESNPFR